MRLTATDVCLDDMCVWTKAQELKSCQISAGQH